MRHKVLERLNVLDYLKALVGHKPEDREDSQFDTEPFVEPSILVESCTLVHALNAQVAFTILDAVVDGNVAVKDRLDNKLVGCRDKHDQEH